VNDYYKILGISPDAGESEIRTAYRRLARKFHPDAGEGSSSEKFRAIQDAYELLTDSEKRKEYDRSRETEYRDPAAFVPHYSARSSHIDLRGIVRSPNRTYAEPIEFRISKRRMNDIDERWEKLLHFLFRDFW
jgi:curved DNA-binding protein CbpA